MQDKIGNLIEQYNSTLETIDAALKKCQSPKGILILKSMQQNLSTMIQDIKKIRMIKLQDSPSNTSNSSS